MVLRDGLDSVSNSGIAKTVEPLAAAWLQNREEQGVLVGAGLDSSAFTGSSFHLFSVERWGHFPLFVFRFPHFRFS